MAVFECIDDLKIGRILEVNAGSIRVELDNNLTDLTKSYEGRVYSIGQIGSVVKIHFGKRILFAYVKMLRMKSDVLELSTEQHVAPSDDSRILEADLFSEGVWSRSKEELAVSKGVSIYPLPMQNVYITTAKELNELYMGAERVSNGTQPHVVIGEYIGGSIKCKANVDKLFGHHCAILGSTGSGKSGTVASIIHSVLDFETENQEPLMPRIIMVDPHGEYGAAFGERAKIYQAYSDLSGGGSQLKLPYWLLSGDELRSLIVGKTEQEATSQNNVIYKALKYSRMVKAGIVKSYGDNPTGDADLEFEADYTDSDETSFDRDKPYPFDLNEFVKHIDKIQGRKPGKTDLKSQSDRKSIDSILDKLNVLRSDPRIAFMMRDYNSETDKIDDIMQQFFGRFEANDLGKHLRIIDISGLPNEIAGVLTATISRLLFQFKLWERKSERSSNPVLLVCEEAHRYVPNAGEAQYREAQSAIRRIAKEGRKYGLGLMLVSQRPSEVESTVLSQCNSWIVLRLTNSTDKNYVANMLPDNISSLTQLLSSFTRREALFVGEAAAFPTRLRIRKLECDKLPDSSDISFINGWKSKPISNNVINNVMNRWMGTNTDEVGE